ncbi:Fruit protein [Nymphaea thermarum]|nr:Fruit protein [Nymphaea thermarum]
MAAATATASTSFSPPPRCLLRRRFHASPDRAATMPLPRLLLLTPHQLRHRLRRSAVSVAASVKQEEILWTRAPVSVVEPAAESLFHVSVDLSDSPGLAASYVAAGQYLQVRALECRPAFLAIASPPSPSGTKLDFLIKDIDGSAASLICRLRRGDVVELGPVMGKGFNISEISPPESFSSVLIFATGSGISPIRALIESGFDAKMRPDVRLYYGARNLQRMAYQDRFKDWESYGVNVVPVLSQPDDRWTGEKGYVQAAFARAKQILDPSSTGAVLCGHKQMAEDVTSILVADGVSSKKILKNF